MEEILPQRPGGAGCHIAVEKESTEFFARAQDLPATVPAPPVVAGRQVEQLEGACQRAVESVGSPRRPRSDRAIDLAPHVRELLGEREAFPASRSEISVSRHAGPSAFHQPGDDLANAIAENAVIDISRPVPLRRTDVDQ